MKMLNRIAVGAAGGLAGAFAMSMVLLAARQLGMVHKPIPNHLEEQVERKTGTQDKTTPEQKAALAQAGHHLIGTGYGVGYGLLRSLVNIPGILLGPLYGLGVYAINELGLGPAFELTPHPKHEPDRTVLRRVFMHLIYGLTLAFVSEQLSERYT